MYFTIPLPPPNSALERTPATAPDWLDAEGRNEWDRVIADLEQLGLLKNSDRRGGGTLRSLEPVRRGCDAVPRRGCDGGQPRQRQDR